MALREIDFYPPELGFFERPADQATGIMNKATLFSVAGPNMLHAVVDWDQTLTDDTLDTFSVAHELLSDEGKQEVDAISDKYWPLEKEGVITPPQAIDWWKKDVAVWAKEGLKRDEIVEHALGRLSLRDGAKETLDLLKSFGVPVVILSAGVKDVIQAVADKYQLDAKIVGNELATDESGVVTGFKGEIIHGLNKREYGHDSLEQLRVERPFAVLVGNSLSDPKMVGGQNSVLRVRVGLPQQASKEEAMRYQVDAYQHGYDLVAKNGNLRPIRDLSRVILGQTVER